MAKADTPNIHQRLAAAMGELTYVHRGAKTQSGPRYSYATHDQVTAAVRPVLLKHGIVYYPNEMAEEYESILDRHDNPQQFVRLKLTMVFVNIDDPKDIIKVQSLGHGIDPSDKAPGKAMSYAVKYALLKALGLETGDDPERDHIERGGVDRKGTATGEDLYPRSAPDTQAAVDRTQSQCIGVGDIISVDSCKDLSAFAQKLLFFRMDKKGADLSKISLGAYEQAVRRLTELSDEQVEKLRKDDPSTPNNLTRLCRLDTKLYTPWLKLVLDRLHEGLDDRERQWVQAGNFRAMPPDWDAKKSAEHHAAVDAAEAALDAGGEYGDIPIDPPQESMNVGTQPTPNMANGVFPECKLAKPEGFDLEQEVAIAGTTRTWADWVRHEPSMLQNLVVTAKRGAGTNTEFWTDISRCALMALRLGNAT